MNIRRESVCRVASCIAVSTIAVVGFSKSVIAACNGQDCPAINLACTNCPEVVVGSPSGLARPVFINVTAEASADIKELWIGYGNGFGDPPPPPCQFAEPYSSVQNGRLKCLEDLCPGSLRWPYDDFGDTYSFTFEPRLRGATQCRNVQIQALIACGEHTWYSAVAEYIEVRSTDLDGDGDTDQRDKIDIGRALKGVAPRPKHYNLNTSEKDDDVVDGGDYMVIVDEMKRVQPSTLYYCLQDDLSTPTGTLIPDHLPDRAGTDVDEVSPLPGATTLFVAELSGSQVKLQWTAPGDDTDNPAHGYQQLGKARKYDLRYSGSPINESNFCNATSAGPLPDPKLAGEPESFWVTVSACAQYWAMRTQDHFGNWSAVGPSLHVEQLPSCPPPSPPSCPAPRSGHVAIFDPVCQRMVMFGGQSTGAPFGDTWALSLSGTPTWTELVTNGAPPSASVEGSATYDLVGHRMIYLSGLDSGQNGIWTLDLSTLTWSGEFVPVPDNPNFEGRTSASAVWDPIGQRLIIYGGFGENGQGLGDTWDVRLNLNGTSTWIEFMPPGGPPARGDHCAVYDPTYERMLVVGGVLAGGSWTTSIRELIMPEPVSTYWSSPSFGNFARRRGASIVWEGDFPPGLGRAVLWGGLGGSGTDPICGVTNSLHLVQNQETPGSLSTQTYTSWPAGAPTGRTNHVAVYDPLNDRMVVFGGFKRDAGGCTFSYTNETWQLAPMDLFSQQGVWTQVATCSEPGAPSSEIAEEPTLGERLFCAVPSPNPASTQIGMRFVLPGTCKVRATVLDLSGRHVRTLMDDVLDVGEHVARWNLENGRGQKVAPGIYFIRLQAGEEKAVRKLLVN